MHRIIEPLTFLNEIIFIGTFLFLFNNLSIYITTLYITIHVLSFREYSRFQVYKCIFNEAVSESKYTIHQLIYATISKKY